MNRFRWRISAYVSAAVLIATLALMAAPAMPGAAVGYGSLVWTGTLWKDVNCGTASQQFDARLYKDVNYGGTTYRLCTTFEDFCNSPYGVDSSQAETCHLGIPANGTMNDVISSVKIISVGGGSSCRVRIHEHTFFGGGALTYWDPVWVPTLVPWPNDALSSIRRVC